MNAFFKIFAVITVLSITGLYPMKAASEETLKFRHITSIYADDQGLGLRHPEGVACNENALLIVADTDNSALFAVEDQHFAPGIHFNLNRIDELGQFYHPGAFCDGFVHIGVLQNPGVTRVRDD